jgi:hypothetical protein
MRVASYPDTTARRSTKELKGFARRAWVAALGGIAAACGSSSDLDAALAGASSGGASAPGQGGAGGSPKPIPVRTGGAYGAGGAATTGGAPSRTGGRPATGGVCSSLCALGSCCSTPNSYCVNGSLACQCVNGAWGLCTVSNTGGVPATGGTASATGGTGQIGATDPASAVKLPDDYYTNGTLHGYCYTYSDSNSALPPVYPSSVLPACSTSCFNAATGMCIAGELGISTAADSYAAWGVGVGCTVGQARSADGGSVLANPVSVAGMTSITIAVYGVAMPASGYSVNVTSDGTSYCAFLPSSSVTAGAPFTVPLASLRSQCWTTTGAAFDPATMQITNLSLGVRTGSATQPYDICVSQFTIS